LRRRFADAFGHGPAELAEDDLLVPPVRQDRTQARLVRCRSAPGGPAGSSSASSRGRDRTVQRIAGAFEQSRIPHEVSTDITRVLWEKFLFITGVGGRDALARSASVRSSRAREPPAPHHRMRGDRGNRAGGRVRFRRTPWMRHQQAAALPRNGSSMARDFETAVGSRFEELSGASFGEA